MKKNNTSTLQNNTNTIEFENASETEKKLKSEGINYKGFGILYKYVMLDIDLPLISKIIYAYLCSYAGSASLAFPGRDKILSDLKLTSNTYYKYLDVLKNQGYITIEKSSRKNKSPKNFPRNLYRIIERPKKFFNPAPSQAEQEAYNNILRDGLTAAGYGSIPKAVMTDPRLTFTSKALYAYHCAFAGNGNVTFPARDIILYHLNISKDTYYDAYNVLVGYNYITSIQERINGKLGGNYYYLNEKPSVSEVPAKLIKPRKKSVKNKPFTNENPETTDFAPCPDSPCPEISDAIINSGIINSIYKDQSIKVWSGLVDDPNDDGKTEYSAHINNLSLLTKEIIVNKEIPYPFLNDKTKISQIIKEIIKNNRINNAGLNSILNQCLVEMLTEQNEKQYGDYTATNTEVLDILNQSLVFENNETIKINPKFIADFTGFFQQELKKRNIKNLKAYIKSCLFRRLVEFNVFNVVNDMIQDTNDSAIAENTSTHEAEETKSKEVKNYATINSRQSVLDEIIANNGIPRSFGADKAKAIQAAKIITEGIETDDKTEIKFIQDNLADLITAKGVKNYGDYTVNSGQVIEKINALLDFKADKASLNQAFINEFIERAKEIKNKYEIQNKKRYMQSCLCDFMFGFNANKLVSSAENTGVEGLNINHADRETIPYSDGFLDDGIIEEAVVESSLQEAQGIQEKNNNQAQTNTDCSNYFKYIDNLAAEKELDKAVYGDIALNNGIPFYYKDEPEKMRSALRQLFDYSKKFEFTDQDRKNIAAMMEDCLADMMTARRAQIYKGAYVQYSQVIKKVNEIVCVKTGYDDQHRTRNYFCLDSFFVTECVNDVYSAMNTTKIQNIAAYMKSCIWNSLVNFRVQSVRTRNEILDAYAPN